MTLPSPRTAAEAREAIRTEYGQYRAAVDIDINGVRAFNAGDPVPISHVEGGIVSSEEVEPATAEEPAPPPTEPAVPESAPPAPSRARSARAAAEEAAPTADDTPKG